MQATIECPQRRMHRMRAFLVMLMFTLSLLQFPAAATVECCGHASVSQGPQQPDQTTEMTSGSGTEELAINGLGLELDSGNCHANCAAAVTATTATMASPASIERAEHLVGRFLLPWLGQPYRPRWFHPSGSGLNADA